MAIRNEVQPPDLSRYLPLAGGTMTGSILVNPNNAIDLGAPAARWRSIYVYTAELRAGINATPSGTSFSVTTIQQPTSAAAGYAWNQTGSKGGNAGGGTPGGAGGAYNLAAGIGGDGTGALAAGNGGTAAIDAGAAGTNNGGGAGVDGDITIGANHATTITLGNTGTTTRVNGLLRYDNTSGAATPGALPSPGNYSGYLVVSVAGINKKVPYFDN